MSFRRLVDCFDLNIELPIEIPEVRAEIVRLGSKHDTIIILDADIPPEDLGGLLYHFRGAIVNEFKSSDEDPKIYALIVYNKHLTVAWQRVIACKELIHILDSPVERVNTEAEFDSLVTKLLGRMASEDFGLADFVAAKDRLALYQALLILFPRAAREQALHMHRSGERTIEQIAEWACIPPSLVSFVMSDEWPEIRQQLLDC